MNGTVKSESGQLPPEAKAFLQGVGQALREARQQRREELDGIAAFLRIKPAFLDALERGDYEQFPGRAYAYGFLRSYADYLGFDGAEVVRRVKANVETSEKPKHRTAVAAAGRLRPALAAAALAGLILAGGLVWRAQLPEVDWLLSGPATPPSAADGQAEPATVGTSPTAATDAPSTIVPVAAPAPGGQLPERLRASERVPPVMLDRVPIDPARGTVEARRSADGTSAVAAEVVMPDDRRSTDTARQITASHEVSAPDVSSGLELVARAQSWVQIRSRDGSYIRTRSMEPGDRWPIAGRDDLLLWAGDAGAVEVYVDGRPLGRLGAPGTVLRDLPLDPHGLRQQLAAR